MLRLRGRGEEGEAGCSALGGREAEEGGVGVAWGEDEQ